MPLLHKITIKNFKSIARQEIGLGDLNMVIGANGAGKSNLISVFRLLDRILVKRLQLYVGEQGGAERFLFHGQKNSTALEIRFDFLQHSYGFRLKPAVGDTLVFEWELYDNLLGSGHKESLLEPTAAPWHNHRWVIHHFHDTSDSAPSKRLGPIDDNQFLRPDAGNLAAYLFMLRNNHPVAYRHIVEHVQLVAPFFDNFILEPSRSNTETIKLAWSQKGSDAYFDGYALSDGTLRFICLATLLLQPAPPGMILLDEPELGLHPLAIRILSEMLDSTARHAQVVVATQSVTLLNNFSPETVLITENDGLQTSFSRLNAEKLHHWLEQFSLGELWEKNVLGGSP
ncbi:MAG: AAA family ATPase [Magnetococcales bacterium]|nr:AAA family ATPase [Magnetococcales bacterium]